MPYTVNGTAVNVAHEPRMKDGVMWVPLRELSEAMGAKVDFEPSTHAPILYLGDDIVTVMPNTTQADLNGTPIQLNGAPFIHSGETFVPVRFFEQLPGVQLSVNPDALQVDIMQSA